MARTRKIDVYINGTYQWSTCLHSRCKDAIAHADKCMHGIGYVPVASVPDKRVTFKASDKIRAFFAKN